MNNNTTVSQFDFVDWLLEAETPSIRYLTLRNLLQLPDNDLLVKPVRQAIMNTGLIPAILANQTPTGQWANEHSYYTPKFVSTHWNLTLLTELCVDPDNEQFQRGVEYMLGTTAEQMQDLLVKEGHGFSCFWGNLLRYALYAGRADDLRVQAIVKYAADDIRSGGCSCQYNDGLSCAWGVVRTLWGLSALSAEQRPAYVQAAMSEAVTFVLESFSLIDANYPTPAGGKIHPLWFKLNFPLFYQVDILFTLRVLAEFGAINHPGTAAALDWLEGRRLPKGFWRGSNPYRQRAWSELGNAAETSRWVSLQSALIMQAAGRSVYLKEKEDFYEGD